MDGLQKHRNAKQECKSTGEREKNVVQERRNAEREGKIEEQGHTGECKGLKERMPISDNDNQETRGLLAINPCPSICIKPKVVVTLS